MPYIKQDERKKLEKILKLMKKLEIKANGDLNYILFTYCKRNISLSYNNLKNYLGELNQTISEIERKILGPYEDQKIKENGDILWF